MAASPVYWIGQDGNIYYGSGVDGVPVQNLGSATNGQYLAQGNGLYDKFTDSGTPSLIYSANQISDPNAPAPAPVQGSTGRALDTASVNNTQLAIDQLPGLLDAALAAEKQKYDNANSAFNSQEQLQRGNYDTSSTTNQQNYDSNFMDSIRAGIKGLGGLFALLRGTGAGGGTAEQMAKDTVGGVTANDIRSGADARDQNQIALDASLSSVLSDLKQKRQENQDTYTNNQAAARRESNTSAQDLYSKMAGYYSAAGQNDAANSWMTRAGALTPSIAQDSKVRVSNYDTTPVAVQAPKLTAFKTPTQPSVVASSPQQIGAGIFTMSDRKKNETSIPSYAGA